MEEVKVSDILFKAEILRKKIVRKCTPTSGALYLHKSLIGKTFDVFLVPKESSPQVADEVKKAEESIKKNLEELKN